MAAKEIKIPKLVMWDIQDTLISGRQLASKDGIRVVRGNCLELATEKSKLPLLGGMENALQFFKYHGALQGVVSDYAYQFAMNYISASPARDYLHPGLYALANKKAWEGMVLKERDYDSVLELYARESPRLLKWAKAKAERVLHQKIWSSDCLHIGDQSHDRESARSAGWEYLDVNDLREVFENEGK